MQPLHVWADEQSVAESPAGVWRYHVNLRACQAAQEDCNNFNYAHLNVNYVRADLALHIGVPLSSKDA